MKLPVFDTMGIMRKDVFGDRLAYAIVFYTHRDRDIFIKAALTNGDSHGNSDASTISDKHTKPTS